MYAEVYLTDKLKAQGVCGIGYNDDGTLCFSYTSPPDAASVAAVSQYTSSFDIAAVENVLQSIALMERQITPRMLHEAIGGDTTINPAWCGGAGGTAQQHIAWITQQKAALRAQLPK